MAVREADDPTLHILQARVLLSARHVSALLVA
jgi:hypothetical protein